MDIQQRRQKILMEMAQIDIMEKGQLTEEYRDSRKDGNPERLGPYYKYQRWENGKNVSRRVPGHQVAELRQAIEGYQRFHELAEEYVQLTVDMTRDKTSLPGKKKPGSFLRK